MQVELEGGHFFSRLDLPFGLGIGAGLDGKRDLGLELVFQDGLQPGDVFRVFLELLVVPGGVVFRLADVGERDGEGILVDVACFEAGSGQSRSENEVSVIGEACTDGRPGRCDFVAGIRPGVCVGVVSEGKRKVLFWSGFRG